ncbi:hypothetical protein HDZ31DRAFT_66630 [Schizophyllum fasciatum]
MSFAGRFATPRSKREYNQLDDLRNLAQELAGDIPFSPGTTRQSALATMLRILNSKTNPAFASLMSDPPPGILDYDSDIVGLIVASFSVFAISCMASEVPQNHVLAAPVRALWPHTIKWAAVLHPARRRVRYSSDGAADPGRKVLIGVIVQIYLNIVHSEPAHVKPFLHDSPDAVAQALELWLRFPKYIAQSDPDAANWAHSLGLSVADLYELLIDPEGSPTAEDRTLFLDSLRATIGTERTLQRAVYLQTDFLRGCAMPVSLSHGEVWREHFRILLRLICLPEFWPAKVPRKAITSVVSAAQHCIAQPETQKAAFSAVRLVAGLCCITGSNRPLVRAVDAGIFEVMYRLGHSSENFDLSDFVQHMCAGLVQPRLIRAFRRRGRLPPSARKGPRPPKATWHDVVSAYEKYSDLYSTSKGTGGWRRFMQCQNDMGPHDQTVRICPCGRVYYCSGSCQRMHWRAMHREECLEDDGPWNLKGAVSLSDVVFVSDIVSWHISDFRQTIAKQIARLSLGLDRRTGEVKQAVIVVDLTDLVGPQLRHEVSVRSLPASVGLVLGSVVAVELVMRLGNIREQHALPCMMPLYYFGL